MSFRADGKLMDEIESIAKTYKSDKGKMYDYIQHGITRFENNLNQKIKN